MIIVEGMVWFWYSGLYNGALHSNDDLISVTSFTLYGFLILIFDYERESLKLHLLTTIRGLLQVLK